MAQEITGITGAVKATIAGYAQQYTRLGTDFVRSIAGISKEGDTSQKRTLSNLDERMKGGHAILTYPINVDNDMQQGHYILFEINEIDEGKLARNKREQANINSAYQAMLQTANTGDEYESARFGGIFLNEGAGYDRRFNAELGLDLRDPKRGVLDQVYDLGNGPIPSIASQSVVNDANSMTSKSIVKERLATKRNHTTIALYMPPNIQVSYDIKYADETISSRAGAGDDFIAAFSGTKGNMTTKINAGLDGAKTAVNELVQEFAMGTVDLFAGGAKALLELNRGTVITPRMELMFDNVGRRSFSYTFNFLPKSEKEAKIVENIIYHFKLYSMPEYTTTSTRREMKIPGTFDIKYYYGSSQNTFLNRVSTCFLTNVSVEYGADRFTAYKETTGKFGSGAPPQKSKMTLNFQELETLSQDSIREGF